MMSIRSSSICRCLPACSLSLLLCVLGLSAAPASVAAAEEGEAKPAEGPVSFYRQVRPILQRRCVGCHFQAKKGGKLMLTSYADFRKGGENGESFVAGKPEESLILDYISGEKPAMPLNGDPLTAEQVALIGRWIAEGAGDDTPEGLQESISADKPPIYQRPPVITAIAYSPDGQLLAISGFREILLHAADGSGLQGRLIGQSQRIESLAFSPDGKILAAVGGTPALFGEVQLWNVAERKLIRSLTISYDTLFGASFNGDGSLLAFGGADNRARVIRVADGEQVMQLDAHADWVFGTTFSLNMDERPQAEELKPTAQELEDKRVRQVGKFDAGEHLITVSRDMAMKLTIVHNGQFVDNITSITPGALKGGLIAVQRHPRLDQVLAGGADGEPKLYKIFRTQARQIGDDFNRIRGYDLMPGRIFDLEFNADGSRFVAGSSTATSGAARIYSTEDGKLLHELKPIEGPIFSVAFRPDGKQVAAAGFDGSIRLFDAENGQLIKSFVPVKVEPTVAATK